jgi:hypothetical protein
MALRYPMLKTQSQYMSMLGGDHTRIANFNTIWNDIIRIDYNGFVDRYNRLEGTGNVTDLNTLLGDVQVAQTSMKSYIGYYKDPLVEKCAADLYNELSRISTAIASQVKIYGGTPKTKLGQKVQSARKFMGKVKHVANTVEGAYNKFTGPAESMFNKAEDAINGGGSSIYEAIGNWGRRKKK